MKIYSTTIQEITVKEDKSGFTLNLLQSTIKPHKGQSKIHIKNEEFNLQNFNVSSLDIGTAFRYLLDGFKVRRKDWKDCWLVLLDETHGVEVENYGEVTLQRTIAFKKPEGSFLELNWRPTTEDLLSQDWELVKRDPAATQPQEASNEV